jgi:hypothetical protein
MQPVVEAPDIQVGYSTPGRETLAAISDEMGPEIEVGEGLAGRETLAAIDADLEAVARPRPRMHAAGFSDPQIASRTAPYRSAQRTAPYASPEPTAAAPPGRATLEAIEHELAGWAESGTPPRVPAESQPLEVFEMATFVVKGDLTHLASPDVRRRFVADRLLSRLPVRNMAEVDRIDVTPWSVRGTVVVRVWCRVPPT